MLLYFVQLEVIMFGDRNKHTNRRRKQEYEEYIKDEQIEKVNMNLQIRKMSFLNWQMH